jgi:hypothetical protein
MEIEIGYLGIVICLLDIQERQFHIEQYPHEWNGLRPIYNSQFPSSPIVVFFVPKFNQQVPCHILE